MITVQIIIDSTVHRKGNFIVRTSDTELGKIGERYFSERILAEQALKDINSQLVKTGKKQKPVSPSKIEPLTTGEVFIPIAKVAAIIAVCCFFIGGWMIFGFGYAFVGAASVISLLVTWSDSGIGGAMKVIFQWLAAIAIVYFLMSIFSKQALERILVDGFWIIGIVVVIQILSSSRCCCSSKEK